MLEDPISAKELDGDIVTVENSESVAVTVAVVVEIAIAFEGRSLAVMVVVRDTVVVNVEMVVYDVEMEESWPPPMLPPELARESSVDVMVSVYGT